MGKRGTQGRNRVVLVPGPFQGHMSPMLELGTVLHSEGFSITVAHTKYNSPNPSNYPDFVFLPISDNLSGSDQRADVSRNLHALASALNVNCKAPFQECLARMMEELQKPHDRVVCIIYDVLMYFSEEVGNHLKLPTIVLRTSSAASVLTYLNFPRLHAEGLIPLQDSTLPQDLVPKLYPLRFKDLPISNFGTLEDLLQLIAAGSRTTSSAIILNTMDHLEHQSLAQLQQHYQVPFFSIGPLHKIACASSTGLLKEDGSCISWLDKQAPRSVLYVSLGSLALVDEKALVEMAWGLAESNQPFLWVIRPGSVRGSQWIELLPQNFKERIGERGFIVKWAPQKEVLAHRAVGGFWSHCGWNSTLESLSEGVPMICWPCFGDQKVNGRYLSSIWGVGLELEHELERGEVERVIRRLMVDKEGEETRQRAIDFQEKAELSIRKGGSACNSLSDLIKFILSF